MVRDPFIDAINHEVEVYLSDGKVIKGTLLNYKPPFLIVLNEKKEIWIISLAEFVEMKVKQ